MKRIYSLLLSVVLLSACSSVKELYIETYNPAEITYPADVHRILVVNNALPQPSDVGYELWIMGMKKDTCRASADSALWDACKSLGKSMVEADYFDDILLYNDAIRTDGSFLADGKLSAEKVNELCLETGTDAIISFDRLLFNMRKDIDAFADGYKRGKINVEIGGIVRTYMPGRVAPLASIVVADSLIFEEYAIDDTLLEAFLPTPDNALRIAGEYIGKALYPTFTPYWEEERRWYYTGVGSRWKEASAYVSGDKWKEAMVAWNDIYGKSQNKKIKAKLASNLALGEEMSGDFQKAYDWAVISRDLFKEAAGEECRTYKFQYVYVEALMQRIRADKKLDIQFGQ